jgi:acyl-CoA synthetase (AMP-forming)/AMP-acid ligase II/peptidoglycan/LPS O-acetylase OafA/YrhL
MPPPPPPSTALLTRRAATGPSFAADLRHHGGTVAVVAEGHDVTYSELADRADDLVGRLGPTRRLVAVDTGNDLGTLVAELAALRGGHPALLLPAGRHREALLDRYRPDVVLTPEGADCHVEERHPTTAHPLHPELALLLSTSGSTGAPKLVRLSATNLHANTEAIVAYLGLDADDRAITSLPLSYCYGLSVVHTHLHVGGTVVLTDLSVVDPCFWRSFTDHGVTGLAGVPHTFELLDRVGFDGMDLPSLRRVTQAGGRLAPERVCHLAALGRRRGWELFVMYGQTEATARMAYLPPDRAETRPTSIGIPIPGGSFTIDRLPDDPHGDGRGELVYRGPNVMLGYAESPADLALGRVVHELRTGDLARRGDDGLFEIVGRARRFVKPFGLRVDLDRVEELLAAAGHGALCGGDDHHLAIAVEHPADVDGDDGDDGPGDPSAIARLVARECGLPVGAVRVAAVDTLPRLENGKPDHEAVRRLVATDPAPDDPAPDDPARPLSRRRRPSSPREVLAEVLGVVDVPDDATFVGLGGDSLSYVDASVRLEEVLDRVPTDWHVRPVASLDALPRRRRRVASMETGVAIRAVAVLAVVAGHAGLVGLVGGAHLLLVLAGWNFARFPLRRVRDHGDVTPIARSLGRVVVPTVLFVAAVTLVVDTHTWANVALVNNYTADGTWRYWYWFVEVLAQVLLVVAAVLAVPPVRRLEARAPFPFALTLLAITLAVATIPMGDPANDIYRTHSVAFLFVLGWLACLATTTPTRLLVSLVAVVSVPLFLDGTSRELIVVGGLVLLLWWPRVPVLTPLNRLVGIVASASLWIYLTHWQVFPVLAPHLPPLAVTAAAVVVGVVAWLAGERLARALRRPVGRRTEDPRPQSPSSWRRMSRTARMVPPTVPVTLERPARTR